MGSWEAFCGLSGQGAVSHLLAWEREGGCLPLTDRMKELDESHASLAEAREGPKVRGCS